MNEENDIKLSSSREYKEIVVADKVYKFKENERGQMSMF